MKNMEKMCIGIIASLLMLSGVVSAWIFNNLNEKTEKKSEENMIINLNWQEYNFTLPTNFSIEDLYVRLSDGEKTGSIRLYVSRYEQVNVNYTNFYYVPGNIENLINVTQLRELNKLVVKPSIFMYDTLCENDWSEPVNPDDPRSAMVYHRGACHDIGGNNELGYEDLSVNQGGLIIETRAGIYVMYIIGYDNNKVKLEIRLLER